MRDSNTVGVPVVQGGSSWQLEVVTGLMSADYVYG